MCVCVCVCVFVRVRVCAFTRIQGLRYVYVCVCVCVCVFARIQGDLSPLVGWALDGMYTVECVLTDKCVPPVHCRMCSY